MALTNCQECKALISDKAIACPHCGNPLQAAPYIQGRFFRPGWGFEWKSEAMVGKWPLVHVAIGRDAATGRLRVAKGVIAIGQFGIGLITIAQFGIGLLFGFGQFVGGFTAIGQIAIALYFGMGQIATGETAIGQIAVGSYVLAQVGFGKYVWSTKMKDPEAVAHFTALWQSAKTILGW